MGAYDILKLQCDLLSERAKLIEEDRKKCPPDMLSCISTLIYAEQYMDIKELSLIRKQFSDKYGKKFEEAALKNKERNVHEKNNFITIYFSSGTICCAKLY